MTEPSVVSVFLTDTATWACSGTRVVDRPSGVGLAAGQLRVAVPRGAPGMDESGVDEPGVDEPGVDETFEPAPIRFVDDAVLLLGSTPVDVGGLLAEILADAVTAAGAATPVDVLVVACATDWGARRRRTISEAGRSLARRVLVVSVADVIGRDPGGELVLEIGELASTISAADDTATVDSLGSLDMAEDSTCVTEFAGVVQREHPSVPDSVTVVAQLSEWTRSELVVALRRVWGVDVRVMEVRGSAVAEAARDWGLHLGSESRTQTERTAAGPRRLRRAGRVTAGALSVLAAVAAIAAAVAAIGSAGDDGDVQTVAAAEQASADAPHTERVRSGRASIDIPAGWRRRDDGQSLPDRVELVRGDGVPARILLVHKDLRPGSDLDAVAVTLATQIADRADTFGPLGTAELDSRPVLVYEETPDPDSQVRWTVLVVDGLQVSVGCQALRDALDAMGPDCDHVLRSVAVSAA